MKRAGERLWHGLSFRHGFAVPLPSQREAFFVQIVSHNFASAQDQLCNFGAIHKNGHKKWEKPTKKPPFPCGKGGEKPNGSVQIKRWPEKQQQRRRQSCRPSGCCRRRSDPSSRREPGRRKNQRTEHRRAYGPWSRSGRRKRGLLPRCPGAGYGPCRRRKQRRSTSCRSR